MGKVSVKFWLTAGVSACIVCGAVLGLKAFAQDSNREPAPGTWAVSSAERADFLLNQYDLVVSGEFVSFPEDAAGDLSMDGPRVVVMPFAVSRVFKTSLPLGTTIQIQLNADMLRYPGEEISRYSARREFWEQYAAWLEQFDRQMTDLREAQQNGFITTQEYQQKEAELLAIQEAVSAEVGNVPSRFVAVIHGETFYDLGGAIGPDEQYLVGLDWSREDPSIFVLPDVPGDRNIFWGQMRDELATLLEQADRP